MKVTIDGIECLDKQCDKRWCWQPGLYQHRGATGAGSRNTGDYSKTCMERAYRGCPTPLPAPGEPSPWQDSPPPADPLAALLRDIVTICDDFGDLRIAGDVRTLAVRALRLIDAP
jgi:hypothetical protein